MPKPLNETRHFQVAQELRKQFEALRPGSVVPTMAELEECLGVSHGTVARALSELARDGLIRRPAGRQRYRIPEAAERPAARVVVAHPDYPSPNFMACAQAIMRAAVSNNWHFDFHAFRRMKLLDLTALSRRYDALILVPSTESMPEALRSALAEPPLPACVIITHVDIPGIANLVTDDVAVGRLAAEHLLSLGHRKNLIVLDQTLESTLERRLQGWRDTLATAGITVTDHDILDAAVEPFADARAATYAAVRAHIEAGRLEHSAIFCTSDAGAMAVTRALREAGLRTPQDASVIAYAGESNIGPYLAPPLTTVEIDMGNFGQRVVDLLQAALNGGDENQGCIALKPRLVVRDTTGPIFSKA